MMIGPLPMMSTDFMELSFGICFCNCCAKLAKTAMQERQSYEQQMYGL